MAVILVATGQYCNGTNTQSISAHSSITLNSFTLKNPNATVNLANATNAHTVYSFGTAAIGGNLNLLGNAELDLTSGLSLSNNALLTLAAGNAQWDLQLPGNQTISGSGTVQSKLNSGSSGYAQAGISCGNLTVASGVTLSATANTSLELNGTSLINYGTISSDQNSVDLSFSNWTNRGSILGSNSGLSFGGTWANAATLSFSNTNLSFGGIPTNSGSISLTNCTASLFSSAFLSLAGTISRTGGTVYFRGTYAPATHAFDLGHTLWGPLALSTSATLSNLTLTSSTGTISMFGPSAIFTIGNSVPYSVLDNVTLASNMTVSDALNFGAFNISNGLTLSNVTVSLASTFSQCYFYPTSKNAIQNISGVGTIQSDGLPAGTDFFYGVDIGASVLVRTGAANLTLGSTPYVGFGGGTVLNHGVISAETSNTSISIVTPLFTNQGTFKTVLGNITASAPITTTGTLSIASGTSFFSNATVTQSGSATTTINGTFTATHLLLNGGVLTGADSFIHSSVLAGNSTHTIAPGTIGAPNARLTLDSLSTNPNTILLFHLTAPTSSATPAASALSISAPGGLTLNGSTVELTPDSANAPLGYYRIINYVGSFSGSADLLNLPTSADKTVFTLDITRDPNWIDLHLGLLGDANDDGHVDFSDLATVLSNFGQQSPNWTAGNFDGAATIDLSDLSYVLNNFGTTFNPTLVTPEPISIPLLATATPLLLKRRPRLSRNS